MASRHRQRVQTGRTGGSRATSARRPPSNHLRAASSEVLRSSSSSSSRRTSKSRSQRVASAAAAAAMRNRRPGVKKPIAKMPDIDFTDLHNEFFLPPKVSVAQFAFVPTVCLSMCVRARARVCVCGVCLVVGGWRALGGSITLCIVMEKSSTDCSSTLYCRRRTGTKTFPFQKTDQRGHWLN